MAVNHNGNRRGPWGQYYHWVRNSETGKLTFVNGLEPQPGIEFSTVLQDKDGVDLLKLQAQHLLFGGTGNAVD